MSVWMLFGRVAVIIFLLGSVGCRTSQTPPGATGIGLAKSKPYVRVDRTQTNRVALQIVLRRFTPPSGRGPAIWLAGVSHLGSAEYFEALQTHLDQEPLVLFEGIGSGRRNKSGRPVQERQTKPPQSSTENSGLQPNLAAALGLKFQLDAINYSLPNFKNSDLTVDELRQLIAEQPADPETEGTSQSFEGLVQAMQGQSMLNVMMRLAIPFMAANPTLQGAAKLALIEILGVVGSDPAKMKGLPGDTQQLLEVLLQRRNERVISDLKDVLRLRRTSGSITILYGVAHMTDMEERLRSELHYRPTEDRWLTAFEVDFQKSKISPAQAKFVQDMVKRELREMTSGKD